MQWRKEESNEREEDGNGMGKIEESKMSDFYKARGRWQVEN